MNDQIKFTIDGVEVTAEAGQTILEAAEAAGIYIPRLCYHPDVPPHGSCRVCTVKVNGRFMAACTTPVEDGSEVINEDDELLDMRRSIVEMLFTEGNHFCTFCEKSGNCELQAMAYRLGIYGPRYPYLFPIREIDMSHPDVFLERNRCILCGRCVQVSRDLDGKHVFDFTGRGIDKRIDVDAKEGLNETNIDAVDRAITVCPVGSIQIKDTAFRVPIGQRLYDHEPIGAEVEKMKAEQ
jgi:[NiFe] hydrogenase diaphorase moiety small subunit